MKKILSLVLMIILIVGIQVPIAASSDEPSSWAKAEVETAIKNGYVATHLQNNYQDPITREEFAELFVTAVFADFNGKLERINLDTAVTSKWDFQTLTLDNFLSKVSTTEKFTDTNNKYVKVANILGMVNGIGNNQFDPDGLITREQAAIMFVNYLQTVTSYTTYYAPERLDDWDTSSSWAKEAVRWAYGAEFIKGTKAPVIEDKTGKVLSFGHFDTKGNLTREQAIIIISRLGREGKGFLENLVIRGYLQISMERLMSYIEIDGNKISFIGNGYDSKYSPVKEYWRTQTRLKDYVDKYTAEDLLMATTKPYLALCDVLDNNHLDRVLNGKTVKYDYTLFTVTYNLDGKKVVIEKTGDYGYMANHATTLVYYDYDNGRVIEISAVEVK